MRRRRMKVQSLCSCPRILIGPARLAVVLTPCHQGPNLKRLSASEDRVPVADMITVGATLLAGLW